MLKWILRVVESVLAVVILGYGIWQGFLSGQMALYVLGTAILALIVIVVGCVFEGLVLDREV